MTVRSTRQQRRAQQQPWVIVVAAVTDPVVDVFEKCRMPAEAVWLPGLDLGEDNVESKSSSTIKMQESLIMVRWQTFELTSLT
jgi:hypothetical protein